MGKPRLGRSPIAEDSGLGYAEELRTFRHVESAGEPALDHKRLTWLKAGELLLDQDLTHGARGNPLEVKMGEPSEPR